MAGKRYRPPFDQRALVHPAKPHKRATAKNASDPTPYRQAGRHREEEIERGETPNASDELYQGGDTVSTPVVRRFIHFFRDSMRHVDGVCFIQRVQPGLTLVGVGWAVAALQPIVQR